MEWIKTILPLIGVALGWLLSERGKIFADKRQDKRKLKKLLFFLLELRNHFARELSNELDLDKYINILKSKMALKPTSNWCGGGHRKANLLPAQQTLIFL